MMNHRDRSSQTHRKNRYQEMSAAGEIPSQTLGSGSKPLPRDIYLKILRAGLQASRFQFTREISLEWLTNFPGDLEISLYYARALFGEGRSSGAMTILEGLLAVDPEFLGAAETWLLVSLENPPGEAKGGASVAPLFMGKEAVMGYVYALTGRPPSGGTVPEWGANLWFARQALQEGELERARDLIRQALGKQPLTPLAAVTHLEFLGADPMVPLKAKRKLAQRYYELFPDCLAAGLCLADWSLEAGNSSQAVALLHQAAARDIAGQVAIRLFGRDHPYRQLWPESPAAPLKTLLPSEVSAILGWNRLSPGELSSPKEVSSAVELSPLKEISPLEGISPPQGIYAQSPDAPEIGPSRLDIQLVDDTVRQPLPNISELSDSQAIKEAQSEAGVSGAGMDGELSHPVDDLPEIVEGKPKPGFQKDLQDVKDEFERLAGRFKRAGLSRLDGRFPVYVVFSVRRGLEAKYGESAASLVITEMQWLAEAVGKKRGWGGRLFLADQPDGLEIKPAKPDDPWGLKLALADLDKCLVKRGEMIGALLIVGGPDVVPFHRLPNPVDDLDVDVPSDNPYATRDENYYFLEWPVGRLPGGAGDDPAFLLEMLRKIREQHNSQAQGQPWLARLLMSLRRLWRPGRSSIPNYGYTAAIWRQAAASVFQPISEGRPLFISPPKGVYKSNGSSRGGTGEPVQADKEIDDVPAPSGQLGYFNLHGVEDTPEWFGQRDPQESQDGLPAYPVALRPQDIERARNSRNGRVPRAIFSEACYGLHITGRALDDSIALKFLEAGSLAVAGSTCMAYGAISAPLMSADLLGYYFWRYLREGMPVGEALQQAKISHAHRMDRRLGFLDSTEQKTLISFLLYGDPLAQPFDGSSEPKSVRRLARPRTTFRTVSDIPDVEDSGQPAPPEVLDAVREVVAHYLPGMADARVAYIPQCIGAIGECPEDFVEISSGANAKTSSNHSRQLVSLSKQVTSSTGIHAQYARLTLDERGKVVKIVVSR